MQVRTVVAISFSVAPWSLSWCPAVSGAHSGSGHMPHSSPFRSGLPAGQCRQSGLVRGVVLV